ncbi:MAG: VOC family protein [Thiotrichales bacterium]
MTPNLSYVTLGVLDFDQALVFYRDGLKLSLRKLSADSAHPFAFFDLGGVTLALYPRTLLAAAAGLDEPTTPNDRPRISLSLNVTSADEVDALLARARAAGGKIRRPPYAPPWGGYCGFFTDPEGFLWEIVWHPGHPAAVP